MVFMSFPRSFSKSIICYVCATPTLGTFTYGSRPRLQFIGRAQEKTLQIDTDSLKYSNNNNNNNNNKYWQRVEGSLDIP